MKLKRIKNLFTGDFHPMKHPLKTDFIADTYIVKWYAEIDLCCS